MAEEMTAESEIKVMPAPKAGKNPMNIMENNSRQNKNLETPQRLG